MEDSGNSDAQGASDFRKYQCQPPQFEEIERQYAELSLALESASTSGQAIEVVQRWDALRRALSTWSSLTTIRFLQDTRDPEITRAREYRDELEPKLTNLAVGFKRRLLQSPLRPGIEQHFGAHAFRLWQCDLAAFEPVIESDLAEQSKLEAQYTALLASAKLIFQGETLTLSQMAKFDEHPDRNTRHEAASVRWKWFETHQHDLDAIYDALVRLRHGMAKKLNYSNFIGFGYQAMHRIDYGPAEVERFRAQVREHVVPLVRRLREEQASRLGISPLMAWDEGIQDPKGNPQPHGDYIWMMDRASQMFEKLGGGMGEFFEQMRGQHLMDLQSREGKGGGGFCSGLPDLGMPFIFANFNGTMHDVRVFTHEMGHAFQCFASRQQPLEDYLWPTMEACEIHSMGLEFLTWPHMDLFFEGDAARFRRMHLTQMLMFLPYGVAVDHFQHLVYAEPDANAEDRAHMWQEMERIYLPWLRWGNLTHPASGRRWQAQQHIYGSPFYYIDYTLALTCALQLWIASENDRTETMLRYGELCRLGGSKPFGDLVKSAGLVSPFEDRCLEQVVSHAEQQLQLQ